MVKRDPYRANLSNTSSRVAAWLRGMGRRYRRPILLLAAASATFAVGVAAGQAPAPTTLAAN